PDSPAAWHDHASKRINDCAKDEQGRRRRHVNGECRNMAAGRDYQTDEDRHSSISQSWPPPRARQAAHLECKPSREPVLQALQVQ
ncbi:hypothetical protein CORC01_13614, partial [Colletotrichum orchidophilum]